MVPVANANVARMKSVETSAIDAANLTQSKTLQFDSRRICQPFISMQRIHILLRTFIVDIHIICHYSKRVSNEKAE